MRLVLVLLACMLTAGFAPPDRYAVGQVWEYETRPQDTGSLLKIQKIEPYGDAKVYHISIIGLSVNGQITAIHHTPVTQEVLNASVTRLGDQAAVFPKADEGIAEWRRAKGGVFSHQLCDL